MNNFNGLKMRLAELLERYVGGLTSYQLAEILDVELVQIKFRLVELEKKGIVFVDGVRPSNTGSMANVYKLVKVEP